MFAIDKLAEVAFTGVQDEGSTYFPFTSEDEAGHTRFTESPGRPPPEIDWNNKPGRGWQIDECKFLANSRLGFRDGAGVNGWINEHFDDMPAIEPNCDSLGPQFIDGISDCINYRKQND